MNREFSTKNPGHRRRRYSAPRDGRWTVIRQECPYRDAATYSADTLHFPPDRRHFVVEMRIIARIGRPMPSRPLTTQLLTYLCCHRHHSRPGGSRSSSSTSNVDVEPLPLPSSLSPFPTLPLSPYGFRMVGAHPAALVTTRRSWAHPQQIVRSSSPCGLTQRHANRFSMPAKGSAPWLGRRPVLILERKLAR